MAENATGYPGQFVPLAETIRGFGEIVSGGVDQIPESYFFMRGNIDEVYDAYRAAR